VRRDPKQPEARPGEILIVHYEAGECRSVSVDTLIAHGWIPGRRTPDPRLWQQIRTARALEILSEEALHV